MSVCAPLSVSVSVCATWQGLAMEYFGLAAAHPPPLFDYARRHLMNFLGRSGRGARTRYRSVLLSRVGVVVLGPLRRVHQSVSFRRFEPNASDPVRLCCIVLECDPVIRCLCVVP